MKEEIVVISDIWGIRKSGWHKNFEELLDGKYELKFYDACKLAGIKIESSDKETLHREFVNTGIENAAKEIVELEESPKIYIGCSVGGVIAWKAAKNGLNIKQLITISSTRLRYETEKPTFNCLHFFGQQDNYRPGPNWMHSIGKDSTRLIKGGHDIYKQKENIRDILSEANVLVGN